MNRFAFDDVRTRLLVVVLLALVVSLVAATAGFNLLLGEMSNRDANALLRQRVASERALVVVRNGHVHVTELSNDLVADSRVWIFEGTHPVETAPGQPATIRAAASLATGPARYVRLDDSDEHLLSAPIVAGGRRVGTVVVGVSVAPYEHTERVALVASIAFALTLLALVGTAVWWLLRSALRPVALMTEQAGAWIESDLDGRFRLGEPHDDLTRLAWTLDRLLDRIAASLRHERLLSAELSHELRTPLAKLRAEAELALRRPRSGEDYVEALEGVIANADRIERIVTALLAAAEMEGNEHGVAEAGSVARAAVEACGPIASEHGVRVDLEETETLSIGVDAPFAERVLHPVLENACRYARSRVHVGLERGDGFVSFTIADDGPGVRDEERELIFEPATRGSAGARSSGGAGLGLPLARRLARAVAGDVESAAADGGCFVVRLPAA
jgi:signal transduction histidine kinase